MAANNDESKLLEVHKTRYKKNPGTLRLLTNRITWTAQGSHKSKIDCKYSEIKVQRISPESSSKVQLQIVLHDGNSYSFQFTNTPETKTKQERDEVKELLAQLIPAHRMKANKELEEKNKILKENPELYQLYKDLVVSGVITSEEFWASRGKVPGSVANNIEEQPIGLSSNLLGDVQPESAGCNEVKYNLNADTIETIFRTYPAVKKRHAEFVPDKMTEKEFWTKFFQSHYFHRDRSATTKQTGSDIFTQCAIQDEQEQLAMKLSEFKDPILDLTEASPLPDESFLVLGLAVWGPRPSSNGALFHEPYFIVTMKFMESTPSESTEYVLYYMGYGNVAADIPDQAAKNTSSVQSLFRRLNHHSLMVLQTTKSTTNTKVPEAEQNGEVKSCTEPPTKKSRLREIVEYDDLHEKEAEKLQSLKIPSTNTYGVGHSVDIIENGLSSNSNQSTIDDQTALQYCKHEAQNWKPRLNEVLSSDQACHVLTEMSPGGSLMENTSQINMQHVLSRSIQEELKQQYNALAELLRHFWSCFPTKTPSLEEKLVRMGNSLEKYRDNKLAQLKTKLLPEESHFTDHLDQMIEAAITKFRTWEAKRSSSRSLAS